MPRIREITNLINQALVAGNFKSRKFQKGKWNQLAYLVSRIEEEVKTVRPAIIDNDGEGTPVDYNDTYPIQFYHRLLSPLQYPDLTIEGFGNPSDENKEIADMVMICMGDRTKLGVYPEDVCAAICIDTPQEFLPSVLTPIGLESVTIDILDTNVNAEDVFNQEYQGVEFNLNPSMFMLSVKYRLTTYFGKNCFSLCN